MTIAEKVAYLKGLAEGMELDTNKNEGKLISQIIDVLEDIAYGLEDVEQNALDIGEELDAISDDLADVEDFVFGEDEDDCDCCDEEIYSVTCPACGEELEVSEDVVDLGEIQCPACGETLELEFDEDDEEEDDED